MRCTVGRDGHTSASMADFALFHAEDEHMFIVGYNNLMKNVPPIFLHGGKVELFIVSADSEIPEPFDLPHPKRYENLMPQMCHWSTSTIYYMADRYGKTATPCIWLAGVFLPCFQMDNCGLLG